MGWMYFPCKNIFWDDKLGFAAIFGLPSNILQRPALRPPTNFYQPINSIPPKIFALFADESSVLILVWLYSQSVSAATLYTRAVVLPTLAIAVMVYFKPVYLCLCKKVKCHFRFLSSYVIC